MKQIKMLMVLLVCTVTLFGQEKGTLEKSNHYLQHNHQLDIDIKNIFNGLGNATILFRKKLKPNLDHPDKIRLLRFQGQFGTRIATNDQLSSNSLNAAFGIGLEKQIAKGRFVHYYGVDLINRVSWTKDRLPNSNLSRIRYNYSASVLPFFGVKYFLTDRINIGLETAFSIGYRHQKNDDISSNEFFASYSNLRFLTLGYTF